MCAAAATSATVASARIRNLFVSGLIAILDNDEFIRLAQELKKRGAFVIHGVTGTISKNHVYMVPYNGVVFITKSKEPLPISTDFEVEKLLNLPISI